MFDLLQVVAVMVVALSAALSVAHALEFPGKKRLDEQTYRAVQRIYYPGFTIGGIAEIAAIPLTALLLFLTPTANAAFWVVLIAFIGMIAMHTVYWLVTHPVNKYWMEGRPVSASGARFFATASKREGPPPAWTDLRDRWEYTHVARAGLSGLSLLALVISLVVGP
jgi:hypothetical protein